MAGCSILTTAWHRSNGQQSHGGIEGRMAAPRGAWWPQKGRMAARASNGASGHPTVSPGYDGDSGHPTVSPWDCPASPALQFTENGLLCTLAIPGAEHSLGLPNEPWRPQTDAWRPQTVAWRPQKGCMAASRGAWRPQGVHGDLKGCAWRPGYPTVASVIRRWLRASNGGSGHQTVVPGIKRWFRATSTRMSVPDDLVGWPR